LKPHVQTGNCNHPCINPLSNLDVTIGFDSTEYFVDEAAGSVLLTIRVLAGQLARTLSVDFFTQDGSATSTAPVDFNSVTQAIPITLQFSPTDLVQEVTVTIIDDDLRENSERFAGLLSSTDTATILAPNTTSVEIQDNDCEQMHLCDS
jgi:hypothetical protein